jgi:hypothetical protein
MADRFKLLRDIVIAIGVFVPLMGYINQLLQTHGGSVNVFYLPHGEQLTLLALILVPLLVLRLVYAPCWFRQSSAKAARNHPRRH